MVYIPFIYFTLLLLYSIGKSKRFGISAATIAWVDVSAFFSIIVDWMDMYDYMGVVTYSLNLSGIIMYCILWTIIFIPLIKIDQIKIEHYTIQKPDLFRYLCCFLVICVFIYFLNPDVIKTIKENLTLSGTDAYALTRANSYEVKQSKGQFLFWIPMIVTYSWPLVLICWFVSLTICRQSRLLSNLLLLSSVALMIFHFAGGGRGTLIWWLYTFFTYYCFFAPLMEKQIKTYIKILGGCLGGIVLLGIISITVSRFGSDTSENIAMLSFIGYAGEQLNNFCAASSVVPIWDSYTKVIFPFSNLLMGHAYDMNEYYDYLYDTYDISHINVFFTFFIQVAFCFGWVGVIIFITLYLYLFHSFVIPKHNNTIDFSSILILSLLLNIPIRGLFNYPFETHIQSLYIFLSIGLYILFRYNFIYNQKSIL